MPWLRSLTPGISTILFVLAGSLCPAAASHSGAGAAVHEFSGAEALSLTRRVVTLGPRPDGSAALANLRTFIRSQLASRHCELIEDNFTASTPDGPVGMENIICKFPGNSGRAIAITGHYDTKRMTDFLGANDGGSSTGFLLEMAASLAGRPRVDDIYLVFFDGEEAFRQWSDSDSLYGSRHLASRWSRDGTISRLKALINVDMIGDKDLRLVFEMNSAASLRNLVWDTAAAMGYAAEFPRQPNAIGDDHMPFINAGVRALDLIDFDYGPNNSWWHTPQDAMDKLSPHSFEVVGAVLTRVIGELERQ
jgi:Zn-dependent M28 family amino/carboxypeptidase